jgi:hypothetical protein
MVAGLHRASPSASLHKSIKIFNVLNLNAMVAFCTGVVKDY